MCEFIQRINLDLLVERLGGFFVFALPQENSPQIVIGVGIVGIYFDLLLEGIDRQTIQPRIQIRQPQIIPRALALGVRFNCTV